MLPETKTTRFFDRDEDFLLLENALDESTWGLTFCITILRGMGGVGKSTIASNHMKMKYKEKEYDVLLWVCGENLTSLQQSFADIALRLKLPGAHAQARDKNWILIQDWFKSTGKSKFGRTKIPVVGKLIFKI